MPIQGVVGHNIDRCITLPLFHLVVSKHTEEERSRGKSVPKFEARNWKQLTDKQLSKMTPIERSRYMAYEPPAKEVEERRMESLKRVREVKVAEREYVNTPCGH